MPFTLPRLPKTRVASVLGYTALTIASFLLFLWLTFPYDVIERLVVDKAREAGTHLRIGDVGPGFFGVSFDTIQVLPAPKDGEDPDASRALVIDSVTVRPALLPIGLAIRADALGGDIAANVGALGKPSLSVTLDGLSTQRGNFVAYTGIDLDSTLDGALDLDFSKVNGAADPSTANGALSLTLANALLKGGTLTGAMPLDLPAARLGTIEIAVPFENGVGTVETFTGNGEDLQVRGSGTINLARNLEASRINLDLALRATEAFAKEQPLIGMGLNTLPPDREDPSFRKARVGGTLSRLSFGPGR